MDARELYDELCDDLLARNDDVELRQMMGMPCVMRGGRMIGGFSRTEGAMVFKLPDEEVRERALALEGAHLFDPSGQDKPFREWVVVPAAHAARWEELAAHALTRPAG